MMKTKYGGSFGPGKARLLLLGDTGFAVVGGPAHEMRMFGDDIDLFVNLTGYAVEPAGTRVTERVFEIEDFGLPTPEYMEEIFRVAAKAIMESKLVYIGCGAGQGRTGTVLGVLLRVLSLVEDPVTFMREHYNVEAPETDEQEAFIEEFPVTTSLRWFLVRQYGRAILRVAWDALRGRG